MAHTRFAPAYAHALLVGPSILPLAIVVVGSAAAFLAGEYIALLGLVWLAATFWAFSLPAWALGLAAGVVVWQLIERIGGGGPWQATFLGGASVGALWFFATRPFLEAAAPQLILVTAVGAASGAIAGYVGWRAGRMREITL
ncbi:hypothetical protein [Brevundimonas sp.]|uniref:hypothetical protein n=1 Tax=Brevundimonas sp. TaxID=1871086 RepID=UPI0025D45B3C|nr:hypothetical protein [Brevundimonas sp.]